MTDAVKAERKEWQGCILDSGYPLGVAAPSASGGINSTRQLASLGSPTGQG